VFCFKAQVRHRNFAEAMNSLTYNDAFNGRDTIVQMARCSFDIHVEDIIGTLMFGAALIMLHPRGNIDFEYLSAVLEKKQVTYINSVPSLFHSFFTFVEQYNRRDAVKYLRIVCSGGT
jgi:non-ribosomal peptide synthetase component F